MKKLEKEFAIDLLKALDMAMNGNLRAEEEYKTDLIGLSRKEVIKVIKYLTNLGYKKQREVSYNENQKEQKN